MLITSSPQYGMFDLDIGMRLSPNSDKITFEIYVGCQLQHPVVKVIRNPVALVETSDFVFFMLFFGPKSFQVCLSYKT